MPSIPATSHSILPTAGFDHDLTACDGTVQVTRHLTLPQGRVNNRFSNLAQGAVKNRQIHRDLKSGELIPDIDRPRFHLTRFLQSRLGSGKVLKERFGQ
jgi:hypothetical protein